MLCFCFKGYINRRLTALPYLPYGVDGSRNIECNIPTGTIFGVYRCVDEDEGGGGGDGAGSERQALQPGTKQVAAGYATYSSATSFVVAVAGGGAAVELDLARSHSRGSGAGGDEFRVASSLTCPPR